MVTTAPENEAGCFTASVKELFDLGGKTAIVTGGYGHLGAAMSRALASAGALVIVAGLSEEKFAAEFENDAQALRFAYCDITKESAFVDLYKAVFADRKSIDVIVNNAHAVSGSGAEGIQIEQWLSTLNAVLGSVHRSITAAIPYLRRQGSGKIINIGSMYGLVSPDFSLYEGNECEKYLNPPHYGAAKAGIIQLTKYFAVYLGQYNVQVNCISPGPFPRDKIQRESPKFIERLRNHNPLGKIGQPDDLSGALLLLSGKGSDFITGQNIMVDGGWTAL